jgi:hypothetical protein
MAQENSVTCLENFKNCTSSRYAYQMKRRQAKTNGPGSKRLLH